MAHRPPLALSARRLAARAAGALGELASGVAVVRRETDEAVTALLVDVVMHALFRCFVEARADTPHEPRPATWERLVDELRRYGLEPDQAPTIRVHDSAVRRALAALEDLPYARLEVEELGWAYEGLVGVLVQETPAGFVVGASDARRRAGAHYTPRATTSRVVERTLAPLLDAVHDEDGLLELRVCDPAMGSGAFLVETGRQLARALVRVSAGRVDEATALGRVARACLFGVDRDARAVRMARMSLWLCAASSNEAFTFVDRALCHGDSVAGGTRLPAFDWTTAFPEVLATRRGGFDAIVGNPPWVSYAGRAAQPLDPELRRHFDEHSPAFRGYKNLQGVFVHRSATLLRAGGRLGLVLPTSMSDLAGYEPSRRAHDELCVCDDPLPDLGNGGFEGVFQPCMVLLSTRRPTRLSLDRAGAWPLERSDLDADAARILETMDRLPRLPPHLFGERGFQSTGEDVLHLHELSAPEGAFTTAVRVGGDIEPARRKQAGVYCDPACFGKRFRDPAVWGEVKLLIRQTARFPMVALSDGAAFRNSVLAGFADDDHPASFLVAYLNASPVRFYHYMRHRDARQGMPQLKISHLRALPEPGRGYAFEELTRLGASAGEANRGLSHEQQTAIDALTCDLLGLDDAARARIAAWAESTRG